MPHAQANARHGIIPAYAGSTHVAACLDHVAQGSSPHTRGAPPGTTPRATTSRDHPRIRGEHLMSYSIRLCDPGIIPAYAGSTGRGGRRRPRGRDHPRIRGEHGGRSADREPLPGIIPAYAGSTTRVEIMSAGLEGSSPHTRGAPRRPPRSTRSAGDHPRIRGEHLLRHGASPRRGGIIPAYAGSTTLNMPTRFTFSGSSPHTRGAPRRTACRTRRRWDHPRIRGEHEWTVLTRSQSEGSSPHTRGALRGYEQASDGTGIIPAYAGSTSGYLHERPLR